VLIVRFERAIHTTPLQMLVSVATPYFAYLLAESLHGSGVLATVACGLYIGRARSEIFTTEARLDARAIWNTIDFALNGFVFVVIGLQLPDILDGLRPFHWPRLIVGGAFISALVILLRLIWMVPATRLSYFMRRRFLKQDIDRLGKGEVIVMVWSGMRGVLTLAAALSLPTVTDSGEPFPHRPAIIFLAFAVILVTLVGQGLTMPALIRHYRLSDCDSLEEEERRARRRLLEAALDALETLRAPDDVDDVPADLLERYYRQRLVGLSTDDTDERAIRQESVYQELAWKTRQVQRHELERLRQQGEIREATLLDLERELDLADLRWEKVATS
jgi:monovalent cation/hydrogen antiporter